MSLPPGTSENYNANFGSDGRMTLAICGTPERMCFTFRTHMLTDAISRLSRVESRLRFGMFLRSAKDLKTSLNALESDEILELRDIISSDLANLQLRRQDVTVADMTDENGVCTIKCIDHCLIQIMTTFIQDIDAEMVTIGKKRKLE